MAVIKHISLSGMAKRLVEQGIADTLVPVVHVTPKEAYLEKVEAYLRQERISLTDAVFRTKYADHLTFTR